MLPAGQTQGENYFLIYAPSAGNSCTAISCRADSRSFVFDDFLKTIIFLKHSLLKQITAIQRLHFATKTNSFNWCNIILQENDLEY